jgi:hypothetical protein
LIDGWSLRYLEWIIGLERELEEELDLYLDFFILNLVLQLCNLSHSADIFGVNFGLEQIKVVNLVCFSLAFLFSGHLRLSEIDAFQGCGLSLGIFIGFSGFLLLLSFLLVEDL